MSEYKCDIKKCKGVAILTYYNKSVCEKCWHKHCDEEDKFNLKDKFKIKDKVRR